MPREAFSKPIAQPKIVTLKKLVIISQFDSTVNSRQLNIMLKKIIYIFLPDQKNNQQKLLTIHQQFGRREE